MPVDDEMRRSLEPIQQALASAAGQLDQVLVSRPVDLSAGDVSVERRVDLLWNVYGEISNYDRHYSTVRSALTVLLVSVGLAAASDPVKMLFAIGNAADNPVCWRQGTAMFFAHGVLPFVPMLLVFALAVPINIYFQRLTASCKILEVEVERRIVELSPGLGPAGPQHPLAKGTTSYRFRQDLDTVFSRTKNLHREPMKMLLLAGIAIFIVFLGIAAAAACHWPLTAAPASVGSVKP